MTTSIVTAKRNVFTSANGRKMLDDLEQLRREEKTEILKTLRTFHEDAEVVEIRALGGTRPRTAAGYFDDLEAAAKAAHDLDLSANFEGIYLTINQVSNELMARAANRVVDNLKHTTADDDVIRRKWLMVDVDAKRPSGVSATDEELQDAESVAQAVKDYLGGHGWPKPVVGMSGNGRHLYYRIDLPNDPENAELIKSVLLALDNQLSTDAAAIDTTVHNAARITKLFGTMVRKGDQHGDRKHRRSYLENSEPGGVVSQQQLQELGEMTTDEKPEAIAEKPHETNGTYQSKLNVPNYLHRVGCRVKNTKRDASGRDIWVLEECPFDASHGGSGEVVVTQEAGGKTGFRCHHNSCSDSHWQEFKAMVREPNADEYDPPLQKRCGSNGSAETEIAPEWQVLADPGKHTESDLSDLFAEVCGKDIKWCGPWEKWLVYIGGRWVLDDMAKASGMAKKFGVDVAKAAGKIVEEKIQREKLDDDKAKELRSLFAKFRKAVKKKAMQTNVRELAKSNLAVHHQQLDTQPWLLNVRNGTLDLEAGKLREHERGDLITKMAPVKYNPMAECPLWDKFLREIQPNEEIREYLRRLVGYALTGVISEHILPICYGEGSNGKGAFMETILNLLGEDYSAKGARTLLMDHKEHPTKIANLFGMRFVACSETNEGDSLNEAVVKELTGGDTLSARRMHEDFWNFRPTHKLMLLTNHMPEVKGRDHGIWRRIKLIPFTVKIPDKHQDGKLPKKLKEELPGILNWAIEGCEDWRKEGLRTPASVEVATQEYRGEMDEIGQFVEEHCHVDEYAEDESSRLYKAFISKTGSNMSQTTFGRKLEVMGYKKGRNSGGRIVRKGLQLQTLSSPYESF